MKISLFILTFFYSNLTWSLCQAPGQGFLEEKLKESWRTVAGENELKEIVRDPKNYALREEVKSLDRRSKNANRIEREELANEANRKFIQMIETTGRADEIRDFPLNGASSAVSSNDESISIEMKNLSKEDLDVLPPQVLEKLQPKVKIKYYYPYDKFEYHLTYNDRELPMQKAFNKIQNDFEDACDQRKRENQHSRDMNAWDRRQRGFGGSSGQ